MTTYNTFDVILQGEEATEGNAYDVAQNMVWSEVGTTLDSIRCASYIDTVNGVGIYYDYAADYYFFTDETEENENDVNH